MRRQTIPVDPTPSETLKKPSASSRLSGLRVSPFFKIGPFFLSGLFFLSVIFALFSPLPLIYLSLQARLRWVILALATNAAIVAWAGDPLNLIFYLALVGPLATVFIYAQTFRKWSLENAAGLALVTCLLVGAAALTAYSMSQGSTPIEYVQTQINMWIQKLQELAGTQVAEWDASPDELKHRLLYGLPAVLGIIGLVMILANFTLLIRLNPFGFRERVQFPYSGLTQWRAPEWVAWPTVAFGAIAFFFEGTVAEVSSGLFNFFMTVYAIQGLSILSFFMDRWGIFGLFRTLLFILIVFFALPLLLAVGFFDLWFDFRKKLRQS